MKFLPLAAGLAFMSLASTASAATFVVTDVEFPNLVNVHLVGTLPGGPSYDYEQGAGPIFLTGKINGTGPAETLFAYCDDIPHHIYGGAGQNIVYDIVPISQNNAGDDPATNPKLSQQVIDNMSGLAELGYQDYLAGDNAGAGVIQAAIWIEEYGMTGSSIDQSYGPYGATDLETRLTNYLGMKFGPPVLPQLLNKNAAGQIDVQAQLPLGLAVPEPAAWATMLLGFFGLGGALRRRRAAVAG
jgi:hypothetical protein